jgi:outer membrane lipoprotein-sorting protein
MKKLNRWLHRQAILWLAGLLIPLLGFAQQDPKAKEWLDKSYTAFHQAAAWSIDFTVNVRDTARDEGESFEGSLEVKGAKFHLNTQDIEIWFDGKTQWFLYKAYEEVQVSVPSGPDAQVLNPALAFDLYKQGARYRYLGEKKHKDGRQVQEVELIPSSEKSEMTRIVLQIGARDALPVFVRVAFKGTTVYEIHINHYRKNATATDETFVFNPKRYPKLEIIDLR